MKRIDILIPGDKLREVREAIKKSGAGGFLMFYANKENHEKIARELCELKRVNVKFERSGSKIIFFDNQHY